ncbi:MAG TPA: TetR/AcrR family transcriptional regulator [Methylibium sp.]|nr:TetR/AcrR family transcriptional regulator [Methylibium sp.]
MKSRSQRADSPVADKAPELSERRRRRAAEIVAAARDLFLEQGFERTAVSEIAQRVGIVEGLVFSYFPTKRELLHEVLRQLFEPLISDVDAGYARLQGLRARLRFIVWRHVRVYVESPGLARLVLHEVRTGPEYDSSGLHELQVRYTRFVRLAVEDAVRDGELEGPVDVAMLRAMVYGGLEHLMWPVLLGKGRVNVDLVADQYTERLLHGLKAGRAESGQDHEARLARLEALLGAAAPAAKRRRTAR